MSDKTEQPTPKRVREAREKGDIAKSQDVAPALTVLSLGLYLTANAKGILEHLHEMVSTPMELMSLPFEEAMRRAVPLVLSDMIYIAGPPIALVMAVALISVLAQTGVVFAFKAAMPKLENLDPKRWFKKVFSKKNLFEFFKNIIKVAVLGYVVFRVLEKFAPVLFEMPKRGIQALWAVLGEAASELILTAAGAFFIIAAIDWLYQKWKWTNDHKMSKDEVKREYKESEGDPHIKSKRKQLHQEMISQNVLANVRKAKVLVTNPTHYAVALDYEKDRTPLPVILAKGEGLLAQRMMQVAREEGIPIMRNVPLARALYREGTEDSYIPKEFIGPVAEVLRWVAGLSKEGSK